MQLNFVRAGGVKVGVRGRGLLGFEVAWMCKGFFGDLKYRFQHFLG